MDTSSWYSKLIKPRWAPPSWIFGPVWTVLYILITISFGKAFILFIQGELTSQIILPFALNILFNFAFTPLQFGLKNNLLASIDILMVLITFIWAIVAIWSHIQWVAYINIPYLIWVCFATVLQLVLTYLNR